MRLVQRGEAIPPSRYVRTARLGSRTITDLVDPGRVLDLHAQGATIVLQGLQRSWPPLQAFCADLERTLTHAVQANAYLTPPGSQGLRVHHDTHDVFALQAAGRKHWVVHEPLLAQPLPGQSWAADEAPTPLVLDVDLHPGDALYVPRGTPHAAATVDEPSLHVTIGVVATTWHDVLRRLVDRARDDVRFRAALPPGWAASVGGTDGGTGGGTDGGTDGGTHGSMHGGARTGADGGVDGNVDGNVGGNVDGNVDGGGRTARAPSDASALATAAADVLESFASWVRAQDAGALVAAEAARFGAGRPAHLRGQLLLLQGLDDLDDDAVVRRREHARVRFEARDDAVVVVLSDRQVRLPARVAGVVRTLLAGPPVRVGDLAPHLYDRSRLVLVRRLVREGALVPAGDG